jgi:hypothetical protein
MHKLKSASQIKLTNLLTKIPDRLNIIDNGIISTDF